MSAVAVICVGDDDAYLEGCLKHLIAHGVDYAILDNGMGQGARAVLDRAPYRGRLKAIEILPYDGVFALERQIEAKERMFRTLGADWLIHLDVDETMHAYVDGERLIDSITRVDAGGFNVINFDEFVFLPLERPYEIAACPQPLTAYYHFDPGLGPRLMRAHRRGAGLALSRAGHAIVGDGVRLAPESFVLRHYIVRDQAHARRKYTRRVYAESELGRGWHVNRAGFVESAFDFPLASALKRLPDPASRAFDRSDPRRQHYWVWDQIRGG